MNSRSIWSLLAVGCLLAQGCGDTSAGSSELATRQASSAEGTGMACDSDLDCPQGEECELEHGESFCKPHGGDDNGDGGDNGGGGDNGDGGGALDCDSDVDCPNGEECEFEHGGSFCKPHGGDNDNDGCDDCGDDDDHHGDDYDDRSGSNSGKG
ncbi:MAG: hypothetical protein JRJ80_15000 [Deltaproteobacteria bacterium]|nr:hypothetical protein [Deltaproteobacteria bacterium]